MDEREVARFEKESGARVMGFAKTAAGDEAEVEPAKAPMWREDA
jgi:hypothetical protein